MSKRWSLNRFIYAVDPTSPPHERRRFWMIACSVCGTSEKLANGAAHTALPPQVVGKKFSQMGWSVGATASRDTCPSCAKTPPKPTPTHTPVPEEPMAKADPPPVPTRQQRRQIADMLEVYYDTAHERYKEAWSDKALAAKLDLPLAWVAEERDRAYGPDVNEKAQEGRKELTALRADIKGLMDRFLGELAPLETRLRKLEIDAGYGAAQ